MTRYATTIYATDFLRWSIAQLAESLGRKPTQDEVDGMFDSLPHSSYGECISGYADQIRGDDDECYDDTGDALPYGRCDSCGARCDRLGCTSERSHEISLS